MYKEETLKKTSIITIFILSIIVFMPYRSAVGDMLSELSTWMKDMERLSERVEQVERDLNEAKDAANLVKKSEKSLSKVVSRLEVLEQNESGQTVEVIQKGLSDLRKTVEDQQVITAVLEKKYKQAQRPLEPIKASIDEQKELIGKLVARIEAQDKRIQTLSDAIEKKMVPFEKMNKEMNEKLASLEKMSDLMKKIERGEVLVDKQKTGKGTLLVTGLPGTKKEEKSKLAVTKKPSIKDVLEAQGYRDIGNDFFVRNVNFKSFGSSVKVTGSIMNDSEKDYNVANLKIFLYDSMGTILRTRDFSVKGINKGNVKAFEEIVSGVKMNQVGRYAIAFGKAIQAYEIKETVPVVEKKKSIESLAKTKVKGKGTKEKKKEKPKIEEGFKDIGNNFYAKDLKITKFGSSCELTGEIMNGSDDYVSIAKFYIEIFNNQKNLIWRQEFSIKGIKGLKKERFSEFLTGIEPEDVGSFELKSKN